MDEVGQQDAPVLHLCVQGKIRLEVVELLAVKAEVNEGVAVIDLDVEETEQDEAEKPGNLGAAALADRTGVERQHILIFLTQATELKHGFIGAVNVLNRPTDALHDHIRIAVHLRDFPRRLRSEEHTSELQSLI